jgi:4a-hydroxytetrahydrobiopterin dehydratase
MSLYNAVSKLCENRELEISSSEYNDIIHGRISPDNTVLSSATLPIHPKESKWENVNDMHAQGTAIIRVFKFVNFKTLQYFINEMLKYQEEINHHARIVINHYEVEVQLKTQDINDVTEIDLAMAEYLDEIYKDTQYFHPA